MRSRQQRLPPPQVRQKSAASRYSSRYININMFSLNSMYRNRLIRAYLGASNPKRNASLFTGFAENDNMHMSEINTAYKPFHVLNLTLNLVAGERLETELSIVTMPVAGTVGTKFISMDFLFRRLAFNSSIPGT